jgi:nitrate reductase beta subunit
MRLFEMYNPPIEGYQDPAQDQSKWKWTETRKTKLTLRQIRKLRKMLDVRNYEYSKNLKKIRKQYEPVAEETPSL